MHIHQCPYCELRFGYINDVKDHIIHDHRDHADAYVAVEVHELPN